MKHSILHSPTMTLVLTFGFILVICSAYAEDSFILPLPNEKQVEHQKSLIKQNKNTSKRQTTGNNPLTFIPLPKTIQNNQHVKTKNQSKRKNVANPILPLNIPHGSKNKKKASPTKLKNDNLTIPDQVVITPDKSSDVLIEPNVDTGQNDKASQPPLQEVESSASNLPKFSKDTSSAIFMVMKTWQCQDYNGNTLLQHATDVYGEEADDPFKIEGLTEDIPLTVNVDEEDITLDELLDIVAKQSGRDWGVDMDNKTIYFYPPKQ